MTSAATRLPTGSLVVRTGPTGAPFYEAKWRHEGAQVKRRVGPAWLDPDGIGSDGRSQWKPRRGRVQEGSYDEKRATVQMARLIEEHADEVDRKAREEAAGLVVTFRDVATEWLVWIHDVKGATGASMMDYNCALAEPGTPYKRGRGTRKGRVMAEFGDKPIDSIETRDVSRFLRKLDGEVGPRSVNKHRQLLNVIFNYAMRKDTFALAANPVTETDKRREPPAAALDFYEPHEVEALARAAAEGRHRKPPVGRGGKPMNLSAEEIAARCVEDAQDAELFRVLAFTGMRIGEALALRVGDIELRGRRMIVQRAVSGTEEGPTKSWQVRYLPLADMAHDALERVLQREEFRQREDYVFCGRLGNRLDASAVRRRFHAARRAAGLRKIKLHGLRHGAGSLAARHNDAVFIQHFLGHSKLSTTERYMHAKSRREDVDRLNLAFAVASDEADVAA